MGEILPDGTIQGYSCAFCGQPCNIQGSGHGPGICPATGQDDTDLSGRVTEERR